MVRAKSEASAVSFGTSLRTTFLMFWHKNIGCNFFGNDPLKYGEYDLKGTFILHWSRWVVRCHLHSFIARQLHVIHPLISAHSKMKLAFAVDKNHFHPMTLYHITLKTAYYFHFKEGLYFQKENKDSSYLASTLNHVTVKVIHTCI